jgi:hypothetical protein
MMPQLWPDVSVAENRPTGQRQREWGLTPDEATGEMEQT